LEAGRKKAVFIDRDGTINFDRGYIVTSEDIELISGSAEAMRMLNETSLLTIIITNQASIGRGLLSVEQLEKINQRLWEELQSRDAFYEGLYFCPHSGLEVPPCSCRKPEPGLILAAAHDFNIDLASSFVVGDKLSDLEAGRRSGCRTILVLTGHGRKSLDELKNGGGPTPDQVCETLGDAVAWIKSTLIAENQG
jgi:D-glycero-D-manno-heptose 1,7-bisphosphate phosphatase